METNDIKVQEPVNLSRATPFEVLASLPVPLRNAQCVVHQQEILICGGYRTNDCYSYHIFKNKYKFICSYPNDVTLWGHCVVKLVKNNNPNDITLLSFGGYNKHTLVMKYVSVWDEEKDGNRDDIKNSKHCNGWIPLVGNSNEPICIGRNKDYHEGVRAVIGGCNNNLLFITYLLKNIDVFDLNTFQYIKNATLPSDNSIMYHCFINEMMLFCDKTGLLIKYNEDNNIFKFTNLRICTTLRLSASYGYICVNNCILFFGGNNDSENLASKEVYKYSIRDDTWMKFEQNLPNPLTDCVAILSGDGKDVHIIGGYDGKKTESTHMKTNVKEWMDGETETEKQWIMEEEEKRFIEEIKLDLDGMKEELDIKKLKVKCFLLFNNLDV
ncbi:hypothetical protein RFI_16797 [Reticulomyxa filosa]|uniref:Kelch domain-containing protein n=1 Tax=Reticulomyxa filosa TaxID=46433 RepID=X6N3V8_RETFI|nr:hypothetical protein RFI_16797 [Reticulomyxa filosa]|eukprot:ETO20419.1 hypothetical protein RFI_16797 [Reticulomyxa filosa]